jgi:hypothetical protein
MSPSLRSISNAWKGVTVGGGMLGGQLLSLLLTKAELPSGWHMTRERTIRLSARSVASEEYLRAEEAGGITAQRSFADKPFMPGRNDGPPLSRRISFTITPYASGQDAKSYLPKLPNYVRRKPGTIVHDEQVLDGFEVTGLSESLVYQDSFIAREGVGTTRLIAGAIDHLVTVSIFQAPGPDEPWPWEEILPIASRQIEKIRKNKIDPRGGGKSQ